MSRQKSRIGPWRTILNGRGSRMPSTSYFAGIVSGWRKPELKSTPFAALCFTSSYSGICGRGGRSRNPRSCIAFGLESPVQPICSMP